MIRAIVRKELRQLLPVIVALAALFLWMTVIDELLLKPPDAGSWGRRTWLLAPGLDFGAIAELLIGFVIAYSVLPGEYSQRTIDFLYSLPVRRRTLFLTKYLVGVGVHVIADLAGSAALLTQYALTPDSLDHRAFRPWIAALHVGSDLVAPFICVAYGFLMSYFRRLGWVLAALVWVALEVAQRVAPALRILNIKALMVVDHDGAIPLINWRAWALHLGMAAVCLLVAERLWLGRQERFTAFYDRVLASVALRRVGAVAAVAVVALALVSAMVGSDLKKPPAGDAEHASSARVLAFDTAHYHFTYREPQTDRAMVIIRAADQAYADVQRWLGAPAVDRIVADLTEESDEHLGIAGWTKMRLNLMRPREPDALLRHVLVHETTHVFEAALSEGISDARSQETRFFAEGLAEYVAYELRDELRDERENAREVAALAHRQFRLRFQDLLTPKTFLERHDEFLLYPLGELFTAALVDTCGPQSPAQVLRAFASADTPRSLEGFELWRSALQAQRCDVDRVIGQFERRLRRLEPAADAAVPVTTAGLARRDGDELIFAVVVDARTPGPWPVSVRVRTDASSTNDDLQIGQAIVPTGKPSEVRVRVPDGAEHHVEFQAGARLGLRSALFTRWQSTALP